MINDIITTVTNQYEDLKTATNFFISNNDPRQIRRNLESTSDYMKNRAAQCMRADVLEFPPSSGGETDSYVMFFINEYDRSGASRSSGVKTVGGQGGSNILGNALEKSGLSKAGSAAERVLGTIQNSIKEESSAESGKTIIIDPPKKRSNTSISLYMPHRFQTNYGMEYGDVEMDGVLSAALAKYNQSGTTAALEQLGTDVVKETAKGITGVVGSFLDSGRTSATDMKNYLTKTIRNPRKEVNFRGVDFRSFTFSFLLTPRSAEESKTIKTIIDTFKYHMHPELQGGDNTSLNMNYPNDFDIEFKHKEGTNNYINKLLTCVLVNLSVDYTPNSMWAPHIDGAPGAIVLTLQFRELEPLHRGHIKLGY